MRELGPVELGEFAQQPGIRRIQRQREAGVLRLADGQQDMSKSHSRPAFDSPDLEHPADLA